MQPGARRRREEAVPASVRACRAAVTRNGLLIFGRPEALPTDGERPTTDGEEVKQGGEASAGRNPVQPAARIREGYGVPGKKANKQRGEEGYTGYFGGEGNSA